MIVYIYGKMIRREECVRVMREVLPQKAVMCFFDINAFVPRKASVSIVLDWSRLDSVPCGHRKGWWLWEVVRTEGVGVGSEDGGGRGEKNRGWWQGGEWMGGGL